MTSSSNPDRTNPGTSGVIEAVCIGKGGIPKHPVENVVVSSSGLVGDSHRFHAHGGADRALCLLSTEVVAQLRADDVHVTGPGAFGENVLTSGIELSSLQVGVRLQLGEEVVVELTDVRAPCAVLKSIDRRFPDLMLGRSGWMCRVARAGTLAPGMKVGVLPGSWSV